VFLSSSICPLKIILLLPSALLVCGQSRAFPHKLHEGKNLVEFVWEGPNVPVKDRIVPISTWIDWVVIKPSLLEGLYLLTVINGIIKNIDMS